MKQGLYLSAITKISLTLIKGLNVRPESVKLLEEIIGKMLYDIGMGKDF
jgi:hypothetical protein